MSFRTRVEKTLHGQYPTPASPPSFTWKHRVITANLPLTAADSGTMVFCNAADLVISLPATAAGLVFGVTTGVLSAGTGTSVSPVAADSINDNADDADYVNSGATDVLGDSVLLVGNGTTGWSTIGQRGTWT